MNKRICAGIGLAMCFSGCATPQSSGQARYDVIVVSVHVAEAEAERQRPGILGTGVPESDWHAIKVDRYTGETWILWPEGWHPIATLPPATVKNQ